jgi:hypothetical protein
VSDLTVSDDEAVTIMSLGDNFDIIGRLFVDGEGTPQGLRMCIAGLHEAARVLTDICDRWEAIP